MLRLLPFALLLSTLPAQAHEFWIEPLDYTVAPGEVIEARTLNGEEFVGLEYGYSAPAYRQSGVMSGAEARPVAGERGAKPAFNVQPAGPGLNVLFHASPVSTLTYANMIKFERFLKGKRLDWALAEHKAKNFPEEGIREAYFRFVKALVAVGDGAGADRPVGMPYELVALTNPYTDAGDVRVQVRLSKEPVGADVPVYVFHKVGAGVEKLTLVTAADGSVVIPRAVGEFMVNAVHITEPTEKLKSANGAHWVTLWAGLTYKIEG
ncbi:MAG: DUF4198 domain-containing protein [Pseudomonadota bacterium]